jgi:hypothetical protein
MIGQGWHHTFHLEDWFVLQIYVDDIIFGSTNQDLCEEFGKMTANEFEMSMIRELSYFL